MKIGILDIDTKADEKDANGKKGKYPNPACGKIYGYHKERGDEVVYPWDIRRPPKVDILYISTIFTWSRQMILDNLPYWKRYAKEIIIGGSGWDDYSSKKESEWVITKLPDEISKVSHHWLYELYDIEYGIGRPDDGCHLLCGWCMVWRKEGKIEKRVTHLDEIINPKFYDRLPDGTLKYPLSRHLILMSNNALANRPWFFKDVKTINELGLTVHWDQANDITLVDDEIAAALASVDYRGFDGVRKALYFAFDALKKVKLEPQWELDENGMQKLNSKGERIPIYHTNEDGSLLLDKDGNKAQKMKKVTYDMTKIVPEKIALLKKHGVPPSHLNFYVLIGFSTTMEEDLLRFKMLRDLGCEAYAMLYRDLDGIPYVDSKKEPQPPHCRALKRWNNGHAWRNVRNFREFDDYRKAMSDYYSSIFKNHVEDVQIDMDLAI